MSDSIETAMPGDSFPAVAASLDIISDGEVTEGEETDQGGGRETDDNLLGERGAGVQRPQQGEGGEACPPGGAGGSDSHPKLCP